MKLTRILISSLFLCAISSLAFASDICEDHKDTENYAHCSYVNLPNSINKFIQVTLTNGPYKFGFGGCVSNEVELNPSEKGEIEPGVYKDIYTQCNNIECNIQKSLGTDNYTVNEDGSATPYKYAVNPDVNFGDNCNGEMSYLTLKPSCANADYCASATNASVNKVIKVIDHNSSFIYCASNTHITASNEEYHANETYSLKIFQCDDFQCANGKEIGKDLIKTNAKGEVDHASYSFTVDPSFGESCTPYPTQKEITLTKIK